VTEKQLIPKIPKGQRFVGRPSLEKLFSTRSPGKASRDRLVAEAITAHGYSQMRVTSPDTLPPSGKIACLAPPGSSQIIPLRETGFAMVVSTKNHTNSRLDLSASSPNDSSLNQSFSKGVPKLHGTPGQALGYTGSDLSVNVSRILDRDIVFCYRGERSEADNLEEGL
jgi:hypothetical protein